LIRLVDVYQPNGEPSARAVAYLFDLIAQRMTEPEVNISATMPTLEEHEAFVRRRPYRCWYLVEHSNVLVGYVSATHRNEIGVVLCKEQRGKGFGEQAVRLLMATHEPLPAVPSERRGRWIANVAPGNEHSQHLFRDKLGGKLIQVTFEL
jgi:RimJ/RimL family protein N-acetyltransferase